MLAVLSISYIFSLLINASTAYCLNRNSVHGYNRNVKSSVFFKGVPSSVKPYLLPLSSATRCDIYVEKLKNEERTRSGFFHDLKRYFNTIFVGCLFTLILRVLNRFEIYRAKILLDNVLRRKKGTSLLTISNHQSVLDDPGKMAYSIIIY